MKLYTLGVRAIIMVVLFGLTVGIRPASASEEVTCETDFDTKVPVLMVHGFNSDGQLWSQGNPSSMRLALGKINGVQIIEPFDFKSAHFDWVTNSAIGPKLAQTIDCLAQASQSNGGTGKVIIVAHSMGGLVARDAASRTVDGRKVSDELGLVITLGAPNTGSPWATNFGSGWRWYCGLLVSSSPNRESEVKKCEQSAAITGMKEGSNELKNLPKFPSNVPVRAIAGQMQLFVQFLFTTISQQFSDDSVVPVSSAIAEYTNTGHGDGRFVFRCDIRRYASNKEWQGGECTHNEMYKTGYIQESVRKGIEEYIASTQGTSTSFYTMGLRLNSAWEVSGSNDRSWLATDHSACQISGVCGEFHVDGPGHASDLTAQDLDLPECGAGGEQESTFGPLIPKGRRQVGNKTAAYYEALLCTKVVPTQEIMRVWEIPSPHMLIYTTEAGLAKVDGLDDILTQATWS